MISDVGTLLRRANDHGLDLVTDATELDASGLDFLVLHAEDRHGVPWIVRTPRHARAFEGTIGEAKVLAAIRGRLPVAVPEWRVHAPDVIAYPRVKGTPGWSYHPEKGLTWNGLDPAAPPETFVASSARFLAALHKLDPGPDARRRTIAEVRSRVAEAFQAARPVLTPSDALWRRWNTWLHDDSYWPTRPALAHGDLHPGHMLLAPSLELVGVLDWTEAEVTDPSVDFVVFHGAFGRRATDALLHHYQRLGGATWPRLAEHVAERWASNAALIAHWGLVNDNAGVLEHAKGHLATIEAETR